MKIYLGIIAILALIFFQTNKNETGIRNQKVTEDKSFTTNWQNQNNTKYIIHYTETDSKIKAELESYIEQGANQIEKFFQTPFLSAFDVFLFPNRDQLDKQWQTDWNMPDFKSQCWMVASGTASRFDLLSPLAWKEQSCEHSFEDKSEMERLIIHEMVHVYHGQHNAIPDFAGMEKMGWFLEGLAVYASGQLDEERMSMAKKAYHENEIPDQLENVWKGNYRYATAGSLVYLIDQKYGRSKTIELLQLTSQNQILASLNISEEDLIKIWKTSLSKL